MICRYLQGVGIDTETLRYDRFQQLENIKAQGSDCCFEKLNLKYGSLALT